jgi:hypothetical protein
MSRLLPSVVCYTAAIILASAGLSRAADTAPRTTATTAKAKADVAASPAATKPPAPKKPVLLPGTGSLVKNVVDDFEDEKWTWRYNHPKSSEEQDKRMRGPLGKSTNNRWFEGPKRGTPDVVKRVEVPAPGLEGSSAASLGNEPAGWSRGPAVPGGRTTYGALSPWLDAGVPLDAVMTWARAGRNGAWGEIAP